jgi:hypothetical protein
MCSAEGLIAPVEAPDRNLEEDAAEGAAEGFDRRDRFRILGTRCLSSGGLERCVRISRASW